MYIYIHIMYIYIYIYYIYTYIYTHMYKYMYVYIIYQFTSVFSLKHQPPVPAAATKNQQEPRLASTTWCRGCQRLGALGDLITSNYPLVI